MNILRIDDTAADKVALLAAAFRVTLRLYKGVVSEPDIAAGKEEILNYLKCNYPVFVAEDAGKIVGYIVCRIEGTVLWVEHIYVSNEYRRKGIASLLFEKAEEIACSLGGDTVFNYVHPNNDAMIRFLRFKGYTVLNLIEIRKPYKGEKLTSTITVNEQCFDY